MGKLITILYTLVFVIAAFWFVTLANVLSIFSDTEESKTNYRRKLSTFFKLFINHIPGVDYHVDNKYNETFEKPALIIANHQSELDMAAILALSPKVIAVTNERVWNNKVYGRVIRYSEFYPISDGIEESIDKMRNLIERGYSIVFFPEGTRSKDCKILKFKPGAFYLAEKLQLDILPIYLHDFGKRFPKEEYTLHMGPMSLEIGKRVVYGDESMGTDHLQKKKMWHKHYCEKFEQ